MSSPDDYLSVNTELTIKLFEQFLLSDAEKFIYFSSVKACSDLVDGILDEDQICAPSTSYGISKLKAENSIRSLFERYEQRIDKNKAEAKKKNLYILRPCMIHGPLNKGNLNTLFSFINMRIPYPLGLFKNRRSFLSIDNLGFVIHSLLIKPIESGIYNLADNGSISTIDIIKLMGQASDVEPLIWNVPKFFIFTIARFGDLFRLPFNSHALAKSTESYCVSNKKITKAIGKPLPISIEDGLKLTFVSLMK